MTEAQCYADMTKAQGTVFACKSDLIAEDWTVASSPRPLLAPVTTTVLSLMADPAITVRRK